MTDILNSALHAAETFNRKGAYWYVMVFSLYLVK